MTATALQDLVAAALAEDIGEGDVTSEAVVPAEASARARLTQKEAGVVFGVEVAAEAFSQAGAPDFDQVMIEGQWRDAVPAEVAVASGPARALLAAERVALNFVGHLSGIATLTARFVAAVEGSGVAILDTRKTTPGLRELEKAAVRAGGGRNHRLGLDDEILVKENHIALAGGIAPAVERALGAGRDVEVECRTATDVEKALEAGAHRLLLDNMDADELRASVAARDQMAKVAGHRAELEASGGVDLENVRMIAETGVEHISVGALTHSAPALDLSVLLEPV